MANVTPLLQMKNVSKAFPGVKALDDVKLEENIENWRNHFYLTVLNDKRNIETILNMEKLYIKTEEDRHFYIPDKKENNFKY